MKKCLAHLLVAFCCISCNQNASFSREDFVVAKGQMPFLTKGQDNAIDLVWGMGDTILFARSSNGGRSFSAPSVIGVLPGLYSFATRGPQIADTDSGLVVIACTSKGNITCYYQKHGAWEKGPQINDQAGVAPEGLLALAASGNNLFSAWLDLRGNRKNKIVGARSRDGGRTWLPNQVLYISPDSLVCSCCKPAVAMSGNKVALMFRNWLDGNRDLYEMASTDGGKTFSRAQKLGTGSWQLDGCPMDGGGLAIGVDGEVETVWRRRDSIFSDNPGRSEKFVGIGRNGAVASINGKLVYAWSDSSRIKLKGTGGRIFDLGKGLLPVLVACDQHEVFCAWEQDKEIHAAVLKL